MNQPSGHEHKEANEEIITAASHFGTGIARLRQNQDPAQPGQEGVAIQGYDPVAFFTDNKPVKGKPEFPARHNGALFYFASKEHRELFKSDPAKPDVGQRGVRHQTDSLGETGRNLFAPDFRAAHR